MNYHVRPLTGQVLIELVPPARVSLGGIDLPDHTVTPEEQQERDHHPTPPGPVQGIVVAIGPWKKLKNGMALLPPFGVGAKVLVPKHAGMSMSYDVSGRLKMVPSEQVLAVLG